jgi:hypothetical protein
MPFFLIPVVNYHSSKKEQATENRANGKVAEVHDNDSQCKRHIHEGIQRIYWPDVQNATVLGGKMHPRMRF